MSVPYFQSLVLPVLKALVSGAETSISDVRARATAFAGLTPEDVRELHPSGHHQPVFSSRLGWAVLHLERAGLVERIRRGIYRLTAEGESLLAQAPPRIDLKSLRNFPSSCRVADRREHSVSEW